LVTPTATLPKAMLEGTTEIAGAGVGLGPGAGALPEPLTAPEHPVML
jgi:hypothetical protein